MAQATTNLGKIHVFPSETLYNQFKDIIADNDLALLKDDGAYIVAALLEQNGYVKFSNGLILQWGYYVSSSNKAIDFPLTFQNNCFAVLATSQISASGFPVVISFNKSQATIANKTYENAWMAIGV